MIDELDEALRQLLIRELPVKKNEIDIVFDQPKREWSSRLSRPTLNLFLYQMYENKKLRQSGPLWELQPNGEGQSVTGHRRPIRLSLSYLVTAWTTEPEDEHRLLTRCLMALSRYPHIPPELMSDTLKNQTKPIPITVAQDEDLKDPNLSDLWSALDNEWRVGFTCIFVLEIDPYMPFTWPLTRTREVRVGQAPDPSQETMSAQSKEYWMVAGNLQTKQPLDQIELRLRETGEKLTIEPDGRFTINRVLPGDYTIIVTVKGGKPRLVKITVPSPTYDIEV